MTDVLDDDVLGAVGDAKTLALDDTLGALADERLVGGDHQRLEGGLVVLDVDLGGVGLVVAAP